MSKNDGGPAFPIGKGAGDMWVSDGGMSLRDYFAAKAMAALMPIYWDTQDEYDSGKHLVKCQAELAYEYADAMLQERAK